MRGAPCHPSSARGRGTRPQPAAAHNPRAARGRASASCLLSAGRVAKERHPAWTHPGKCKPAPSPRHADARAARGRASCLLSAGRVAKERHPVWTHPGKWKPAPEGREGREGERKEEEEGGAGEREAERE